MITRYIQIQMFMPIERKKESLAQLSCLLNRVRMISLMQLFSIERNIKDCGRASGPRWRHHNIEELSEKFWTVSTLSRSAVGLSIFLPGHRSHV